jgi:hypothetical protein
MTQFINAFRKLSILARMYTGFGMLCLVILVLGLTNYVMIKSVANESSAMSDDAFTTQLKATNLSISVLLVGKNIADMVNVTEPQKSRLPILACPII